MKKIISFILIIISSISVVSAKSINDLYNELNSLETKKNLYNYLTSDEINNILSASLDIEIVIELETMVMKEIVFKRGNLVVYHTTKYKKKFRII